MAIASAKKAVLDKQIKSWDVLLSARDRIYKPIKMLASHGLKGFEVISLNHGKDYLKLLRDEEYVLRLYSYQNTFKE